jgi:hypothetical protein
MVSAGLPATVVHSLLNDGPVSLVADDEPMQVEIEPVLDGRAIHLGDKAAHARELSAVDANSVIDCDQFGGRLA